MRLFVRVLVAVTSLLTAFTISNAPGAVRAGGGGNPATDSAFVRKMLFATSMSSFSAAAKTHRGPDGKPDDAWFDWSADLCSAPLVGNTGRSFDFTEPCRRHDFGYRNTKLLDQRFGHGKYWNASFRLKIDRQFLEDMKHHCKSRRLFDHPTCNAWAYTFYSAVRVAGGP